MLTLKSILVATDLDRPSQSALRTAAFLAQLAGARLHLLHVAEVSPPGAEARLREHFGLAAPGAPAPDSARVIPGSAAAEIVEHAVRVEADAVIMGPHRRVDAPGEMGSTASSVVRTAPCPCLVAATDLHLPLERVVVPIDLSEIAAGALSVALSWASALRPPGGTTLLTALHVAAESPSSGAGQAVHEQVRQAEARVGGAAHVEIREVVTSAAEPAEEILRRAVSESADLLVMGTRGTDATARLGSISAAVARSTSCPVLLVPPAYWEHRGVVHP